MTNVIDILRPILATFGVALIIVGVVKFIEARRHYSLKVDAKFVNYIANGKTIDQPVEAIEQLIKNNDESINGETSLIPVYEAEINGQLVKFKGIKVSIYNTEGRSVAQKTLNNAVFYVNPKDYSDYLDGTSSKLDLYIFLMIFGVIITLGIIPSVVLLFL